MKIALIADDLTGANNAGVRLLRQGFSTATVMGGASAVPGGYDAICVDTDSRYTSAAEARERVMRAASRMREQGARLVCKRIDTLLRGNVGAEIDGALAACGADAVAIVSAAFPETNRVVKGGHLMVDGEPVHRNPVAASDPISPVRHSYVPEIIAQQCAERVSVILLETVLRGEEALASALAAAATRVVVVDAITDRQIDTLANAMARLSRTFVPVDPGPLSAAYAGRLFGMPVKSSAGKLLASIGSTTALTRQQLDFVLRKWKVEPTRVRADQLAAGAEARAHEIESAVTEALGRLKEASLGVVTTMGLSGGLDLHALGLRENIPPREVAQRIADGLAVITFETIRRSGEIAGCYCTGGDITAAFYRHAGATGFEIVDEVMPLVARVRLVGGALDGLPMVTKGGSVGTESTASECLQSLLAKAGRDTPKR